MEHWLWRQWSERCSDKTHLTMLRRTSSSLIICTANVSTHQIRGVKILPWQSWFIFLFEHRWHQSTNSDKQTMSSLLMWSFGKSPLPVRVPPPPLRGSTTWPSLGSERPDLSKAQQWLNATLRPPSSLLSLSFYVSNNTLTGKGKRLKATVTGKNFKSLCRKAPPAPSPLPFLASPLTARPLITV